VRISEAPWSSIEDIYNSIVNHPFMKGLADGSPDIEKSRFYIVQDHMYLDGFIRALAMNTCFETRLTDWRVGPSPSSP
jgi:thiaminase/transcriptional activator TenA